VKPAIVVVGSLNMDFVVTVRELPAPGQTVLGRGFQTMPGGKGANQACAAGKLGGNVRMAGRVGYDLFADQLKASLAAVGVDVSAVHASRSQPTGIAMIWVDEAGQNSIVVASGANHDMPVADVPSMARVFEGASYALFQLETPPATVAAAMALARRNGVQTILDPAPAQPLERELLERTDILTPNETEAQVLLGRPARRVAPDEAPPLAAALRELGPATVILKLGDQGAFLATGSEARHFPAFAVTAVDSTAAGDTFNAALAVALAEGQAMGDAVRFANAAAAVSVTRPGAQASAPSRAEVEKMLGTGSAGA
jgi:ribokinase